MNWFCLFYLFDAVVCSMYVHGLSHWVLNEPKPQRLRLDLLEPNESSRWMGSSLSASMNSAPSERKQISSSIVHYASSLFVFWFYSLQIILFICLIGLVFCSCLCSRWDFMRTWRNTFIFDVPIEIALHMLSNKCFHWFSRKCIYWFFPLSLSPSPPIPIAYINRAQWQSDGGQIPWRTVESGHRQPRSDAEDLGPAQPRMRRNEIRRLQLQWFGDHRHRCVRHNDN